MAPLHGPVSGVGFFFLVSIFLEAVEWCRLPKFISFYPQYELIASWNTQALNIAKCYLYLCFSHDLEQTEGRGFILFIWFILHSPYLLHLCVPLLVFGSSVSLINVEINNW